MTSKKIAIVLAGCGNQDGTEITEAVSLIVNLSRHAQLSFFAPDRPFQAKNFLTRESMGERRILLESARISRGHIQDLKNLDPAAFDALAFPGGFGAAFNLSNWGELGARCEVLPEVRQAIEAFHQRQLPIAGICIAPVLLAKVLGPQKITITVGEAAPVIREIEKTGALHEICPVDDFITDRDHKIITTPAYMYDEARPDQVFDGIQGLAQELLEMA